MDRSSEAETGPLGAYRTMHVDRFEAECFDDTRRDERAIRLQGMLCGMPTAYVCIKRSRKRT